MSRSVLFLAHIGGRFAASPIRRTVGVLLLLPLFTTLSASQALAQGSPYVPNLDPAYADLDALFAAGLVDVWSMAQRPYSRMAFARFAAQAREALDGSDGGRDRFDEALSRLEGRFAREISLLCEGGDGVCGRAEPRLALRSAEVDMTSAASPDRPIRTSYEAPLAASPVLIAADVNPLLQRNQGRVLADGQTVAAEATVDIQLVPRVAVQIRPRVWHARATGVASDEGATLLDAYVRGVFGGVALEVGRNHVATGHGRTAGPVLSHNARGLDMVRLTHERSLRLPWFLGALGPITGSAWLADLGGDRLFPHGKLIVFEASLRPSSSVELGLSLLNHQGGDGAPLATFTERLIDIFLIKPLGAEISDKVIMGDILVTVPGAGLEFYLEGLSTDLDATVIKNSESFWADAAYTLGVRAVGRGREGRLDLWMEGHFVGMRPHTHHQLRDGLTVDRRVFGHPLGPLARSLQVGFDWRGRSDVISLAATWEGYSGDDWAFPQGGASWIRLADNPDENRLRAIVDWTREHSDSGLRTSVRLGYEHVSRFNFLDQDRSNYLAQVRMTWLPN
jgi:hypothetical protein